MAVYYNLYQNNNPKNPHKGMWYARAKMVGTDGIAELAASIEEKCTVHKADVVAVIEALIGEMTRSLQSSRRVKLPGFGMFKLGISSVGAPIPDKFLTSNIRNVHVVFMPELHKTAGGTRTRTFITGVRVKNISELVADADFIPDESDSGSGTSSGSGSGTSSGSGSGSGTGGTSSPTEGV